MNLKQAYLLLTILGAVVPYLFLAEFVMVNGVDLTGFLTALFANGASGMFTADLLISSAVFWTYLISQREPRLWLFILLNMTIGLSCALPAYLYALEARKAQGQLAQA